MSFDVVGFDLTEGLLHFLQVFGGLLVVALCLGLLVTSLKFKLRGPSMLFQGILGAFSDFVHTSPKRVWAITVLTWKEAARKKALFVFVIFALLIMFAGWFLGDSMDRADLQVKNYITFILTSITWLTLPVMLLLSCWGLPTDIKNRSLHTVVTKPVRRQEVVLGRFFGFTLVGTVVVLIMGVIGYFWTVGQVSEEAQKELIARVPVYCSSLKYTDNDGSTTDKEGNELTKGRNVGDSWQFRGFVEGGTKSRAIFAYDNLDLASIEREGQLRLEYNFEAFRLHKGEIGERLLCKLTIVNESNDLRVPLSPIQLQEFSNRVSEKTIVVPQKVEYFEEATNASKQADLTKEVLAGGSIKVEVQCLDPGQFIGMARPDLFIKMPDRSFATGYFKSVFGIWLQMVLVVVLGVTASCFVKGPVATLLTFGISMVGASDLSEIMRGLVKGTQAGGGPFEAAYRMLYHLNPVTDIDATPVTIVMGLMDGALVGFLWVIQHLFPRFDYFNMIEFISNGVDIPWNATLLPSILVTLAFVIPCLILGYFSLQLREMEAK